MQLQALLKGCIRLSVVGVVVSRIGLHLALAVVMEPLAVDMVYFAFLQQRAQGVVDGLRRGEGRDLASGLVAVVDIELGGRRFEDVAFGSAVRVPVEAALFRERSFVFC